MYWPESPSSTHELVALTTLNGYPCRTNTEHGSLGELAQGRYGSGDDQIGTIEDPNSNQLFAVKENFACPEVYNTYSNKQYNTFDPEDSHTYIHIRGYVNSGGNAASPFKHIPIAIDRDGFGAAPSTINNPSLWTSKATGQFPLLIPNSEHPGLGANVPGKLGTIQNITQNMIPYFHDDDNPDKIDLYVLRSFGESFFHSITDACLEFGYKID